MKLFGFNITRDNAKAVAPRNNDVPAGVYPPIGLMSGIFDGISYGNDPLSMPFNLGYSNQYNPLSLNRILLSYTYMTHGVIQTMIDQPVDDGFRGGVIIKSEELDVDDINLLQKVMEQCDDLRAIKDAMRWAKLYGGGALIINTNQDPMKELRPDIITDQDPLAFIAADRWEVTLNYIQEDKIDCPYNYYGQPLHKSRVIKVMGKEAPAFIRRRLQGWGMSEVERVIRPINQYIKEDDLIYQLLDEAKIDVYKIAGYNASLLSQKGNQQIRNRFSFANLAKNYHSALVLDKEDDYEQKQVAFSGLAEIMKNIHIGIAAAVRMPMTKLFGLSASGFNAGDDDIENYNSMVESEVRSKSKGLVIQVVSLRCQQIFGFVPEDLSIEFHPLRVLSLVDEESVKTQQQNRISALYSQGMFTGEEYDKELRAHKLIENETLVGKGLREPEVPQASLDIDIPQKAVPGKISEQK